MLQVRWSYGVRLLSQADPEPVQTEADEEGEASPLLTPDEVPFPPSAEEERILRHETSSTSLSTQDSRIKPQSRANPGVSVEEVDGRKFFYSFPNTPASRRTDLPGSSVSGTTTEFEDNDNDVDADDDDLDDGLQLPPSRRATTEPTSSRWQSRMRRLKRKIRHTWRTFREFMTAPLWAALASLLVACIQPLQHALEMHLPPVKGALASAGNCSIPVTLVVLGAYFYVAPDPVAEEARRQASRERRARALASASRTSLLLESVRDMFSMKPVVAAGRDEGVLGAAGTGGGARPGETRTVWVAILSRMIITPIVLLPLMVVSTKFDIQRVFDECVLLSFLLSDAHDNDVLVHSPVFVVSNVLLIASPPALTLAQITQAASGDAFERLISRTIFWSYCVVTPPSTILFVVIGLILSKL